MLAAPILPEKAEAWRRFCQEMMGRRRPQYERSRRALCIVREAAWLVSTPHGAMAIIALSAPDIDDVWRAMGESQRPFDRWFRRRVLQIHGLDLARAAPFRAGAAAFQWSSHAAEETEHVS